MHDWRDFCVQKALLPRWSGSLFLWSREKANVLHAGWAHCKVDGSRTKELVPKVGHETSCRHEAVQHRYKTVMFREMLKTLVPAIGYRSNCRDASKPKAV